MTTRPTASPPLASYVLRVTRHTGTLHYELHNVRTGERHRFSRADALAAFLREHGLPETGSGGLGPGEPEPASSTPDGSESNPAA